ncbi:MAG: hypothetical protein LBB72_07865 [Spirochaetaceae bacterium]|nr:hypothetical protein [Spirochaetaceae bacterium]
MTKSVFFKVSALCLTLVLVFGFTACGGGGGTTAKSSDAKLTAITIGGNAVETLPQPISSAVWDLETSTLVDEEGQPLLESDQTEEVVLERDVDLLAIPITFSASSGASVAFGRAAGLTKPATSGTGGAFVAAAATYAVPNNMYLYLRVTAEDGNVNYYRFHITRKTLVTTLSSLTIGSKTISFSNNNNSSTDNYDGMASAAIANLSSGDKTNATVTAAPTNSDTTTIRYAVVKGDVTTAPVFGNNNVLTFEDDDTLYIEVTAADSGETETRWYKFLIMIGRDATLNTIIFADDLEIERLGVPLESVEAFDELEDDDDETVGKMQFEIRQPLDGFMVKAVANDEDAEIKLSQDGVTFEDINDSKIAFTEGDFLYVKVTAGNGIITLYYKIKMVLRRYTRIIYGSPSTWNVSGPENAVWNTTEWMPVNRLNKTEGATGYNAMAVNERTHGQVKLLWDEDGIWVFAQVWEKNVTASAVTSDNHMASSVELFINEAYSAGVRAGSVTGSASNGGQYRLGANGEVSGAPDAAAGAMRTLNHYSAVKFTATPSPDINSALTSGYKVIFHAPWRFTNLYPIADQKDISLELQINATGSDSRRGGVLNWNNENSNSYNSLKDYGEAVLDLAGGELKAFPPIITEQPEGENIVSGGGVIKALSVTAESPDGGNLTYQWYSNTTSSVTGGTLIAGATDPTYAPTVTAVGMHYYWVVVTNTKTSNSTSKSVNSAIVRINIKPAGSTPDWVLEFDPPLRNEMPVNNNTDLVTILLDKYSGETVSEAFDITKYATMSIYVKVFTKNGVEFPLTGEEWSICTTRWYDGSDVEMNSGDYNVGRPDKPFLNRTIPAAVLDNSTPLKKIVIRSGDSFNVSGSNSRSLGFIEVYKIIFYPPES